jgi:hypothetical protein
VGRPGIFVRNRVGKLPKKLPLRAFVAQSWIKCPFGTFVSEEWIVPQAANNYQLIGFYRRAVQVNSAALACRCQVSKPFALPAIVRLNMDGGCWLRQGLDPLVIRSFGEDERDPFQKYAGIQDMLEDRHHNLTWPIDSVCNHDADVVIRSQGLAQCWETAWTFEGLPGGAGWVGNWLADRLAGNAHDPLGGDLDGQVIQAMVDTNFH